MRNDSPTSDDNRSLRRAEWLRPELVVSWREFLVVMILSLGYDVARSTWFGWHGSAHFFAARLLTDRHLLKTISFESVILCVFLLYLQHRGWRPADLRLRPTLSRSVEGVFLAVAVCLVSLSVTNLPHYLWIASPALHPWLHWLLSGRTPNAVVHGHEVHWVTLVFVSALNGFFEEIICTGYAFNQLAARRGVFFALVVIVLFRVSYHTYQGPLNATAIGFGFFVSTAFYARTRRLWPVAFAHVLNDFFAFAVAKVCSP